MSQIGRRQNLTIIPNDESIEVFLENNVENVLPSYSSSVSNANTTNPNTAYSINLDEKNETQPEVCNSTYHRKLKMSKNQTSKTSFISTTSDLPSTSRLEPIRVFKFDNVSLFIYKIIYFL